MAGKLGTLSDGLDFLCIFNWKHEWNEFWSINYRSIS